MTCETVLNWIGWIADLMLAVAALYVTVLALYGCLLEAQAEGMPEGEDRTSKFNDARTYYALASLTKPWVLILILLGTLGKLAVGWYHAPW